jgi:hypothetical protein
MRAVVLVCRIYARANHDTQYTYHNLPLKIMKVLGVELQQRGYS